MKHHFRGVALAATFFATCCGGALAAPATLALSDGGVAVGAGDLGNFTIGGPSLQKSDSSDIPLVARVVKDAQTASYKYFDGTVIDLSVDNTHHSIGVDYAQHSPDARRIVFHTSIPFSLHEGGQATFDGANIPFPAELKQGPDGHSIWRGEAARFEMKTARGQILAIQAPHEWQQLEDVRFWNNNQSFDWMFQHDMARDGAQTHFDFHFEEVAGGVPAPILPPQFVDKFGQSKLVSFPEKITDEAQLRADITSDKAYAATLNAPKRDEFGGLPGSGVTFKLKKTGYFHVESIKDKTRGTLPVLVDPAGNLWFQLGLCSMGGGDSYTYLPGRENKFDELPAKNGPLASAFIDGGTAFSFYAANWSRKYGQPWNSEVFSEQTIGRVRGWGFNSSGAFSGWPGADQKLGFPHVGFLSFDNMEQIQDSRGVFDPFADGAADKLDAAFKRTLPNDDGDPLVIGHFLGNEQGFENIPKVVPTLGGGSGAKRKLVAMLAAKYGDIAAWNAAWKPQAPAKSFDELKDAHLFVVTKAASEDVNAFYGVLLDTYYKMIAETYHKYSPHHIMLGNRWLSSTANDDQVVRTAGKYLDVVSVNYYTYALETDFLKRIHTLSGGKPVLLSEWHFGAMDQGLSGGGRQVKDQHERGLAYRNYVEQAAALGFVVGQEWFSYLDQPLAGRWFEHDNGERGNIGFVNVADRPYKPFIDEAAHTNFGIYDVLLGKRAPYAYDDPRFSGAAGGQKVTLIPRALPGMAINGVQAHWPGVPAEQITRLVLGSESPDVKPASADFRLAWDDEKLWVFAYVKDPTPMQNEASGEGLWQGDSIEMFIGADNLTAGGALAFGDRQVLLSARKGDDGYRFYWNNAPTQTPVKMIVVPDASGDGYTIEAALPWTGMGFKPHPNQELLFDIGFNDNTKGRRQFMWNGGSRNSGDRGAWGRARLQG